MPQGPALSHPRPLAAPGHGSAGCRIHPDRDGQEGAGRLDALDLPAIAKHVGSRREAQLGGSGAGVTQEKTSRGVIFQDVLTRTKLDLKSGKERVSPIGRGAGSIEKNQGLPVRWYIMAWGDGKKVEEDTLSNIFLTLHLNTTGVEHDHLL
jgi:hypothetical protein